jgi:poly(A) polymerase/tRNA nucleotidyltransferase (CCA-adding enzyme)
VQITTLRRDVATDGRHATVAFTDDWRQDAARRDFTINAMSMTHDGAVYDYFGGIADLRAGVLRFVGDPAARIAEDTLRVLRYFRFFARYAASPPRASVRQALQDGIPALANLSAERVWSELQRILAAPDPRAAVALMAELGILAAIIPEGADPAALARLIAAGAPADPLLRLAALLTGDVDHFADRLRLSAAERQRLLDLRTTPLARRGDDDATLRRLLADHDSSTLIDRTWLAHASPATAPDPSRTSDPSRAPDQSRTPDTGWNPDTGSPPDLRWTDLRSRLAGLQRPVFPLEGRDVLALGVPPGPRVGVVLRAARAWWLAGGCIASARDCRAELARQASRADAATTEHKEKPQPSGQTGC